MTNKKENPARLVFFTLLLAALGLIGNYFGLPLFYGVDVIFGSMATFLALMLLGPIPAVVVAIPGLLYTVVLWGQPYSAILFLFELGFVVALNRRFRYLVFADAFFWLFVGGPVQLVVFYFVLGLPLPVCVILYGQQCVSGILNAAAASSLVLGAGLFRHRREEASLTDFLFNSLIVALIVPGLFLVSIDTQRYKEEFEQSVLDRLKTVASDAALMIKSTPMPEDSFSTKDDLPPFQTRLEHLPLDEGINFLYLSADDRVLAGDGGSVPTAADQIVQLSSGLEIWYSEGVRPSEISWWQSANYLYRQNMDVVIPGSFILATYEARTVLPQLASKNRGSFLVLGMLLVMGTFFSAVGRDVSEKQRMNSKVILQAQALASTHDMIWVTDRWGQINFCNPALLGAFGYTLTELQGQSPGILQSPHQDSGPMAEMLENTRGGVDGWQGELINRRKNGTEFPVSLSVSPILDVKGHDAGMIGVSQDISDRKKMGRELARISAHEQERVALELHDNLGAYLAGIAFRFKTLAEKLERRGLPEAVTAKQLVGQVNAGVDQVRNFARLLAPLDLAAGGLAVALAQLGEELKVVFGVVCHLDIAPELPVLTVEQSLQLYRIAQEAARNAVQHGKARQVTISIQCEAGCLIQTIANDGEFWDPKLKQGAGLGLRIMHHRAADLGGTFTIRTGSSGQMEAVCRVPLPTDHAEAGNKQSA